MIVLGFDTETRGLDWFDPDHRAFLLSWADDRGSWVCSVGDEAGVQKFCDAVARADVLVAHNLSFDVHHVRQALGIDLLAQGKIVHDTDVLARVALPERAIGGGDLAGYKLKHLAKTYLKADAQEAEDTIAELAKSAGIKLKSTGGYYDTWRAYPKEMEYYALLDAEYARDLYPILLGKLDANSERSWQMEQRMTEVLIRAEERGVRVNPTVVAQLRKEYVPIEAETREAVIAELGDFDLGSPAQLRDKLLEYGVPLHRTTKKGDLSTDKFALAEFEEKFPILTTFGTWRAASKMLSTYIDVMTDRDVVHTSFWQIGAWTGRMSCSRPNMQNLPARSEAGDTKLREVFVPRDGHVFVVCDFDSIELRLLAYYLNAPEFKAMIAEGHDVFAWLAADVWADEHASYAKGTSGEKRRGEAKNVTYAIVYGAGVKRVSDMLGVPYPEAKEIVSKIKRALPRYFQLKKRIDTAVKTRGFVTTLDGRKQVVARDKSYVGLNALIQGSAAGLFKAAAVDVAAAIAEFDAYLVLFVHDELVAEVPTAHAEAVKDLMERVMIAAADITPTLAVSGSIAVRNYAEGK